MSYVAVGVGAGTLVAGVAGSVLSANAAKKAAGAQVDASQDANATTLEMFNRTRDDMAPYRLLGTAAFGNLYELGKTPAWMDPYQATEAFDPSQTPYAPVDAFAPTPAYTGPTEGELRADPGYAFRVAEGQKALERSAASKGLLLSGGQLKDLTRFGQDQGAQEYGAAYARGYARNADLYARGYAQNQDLYSRTLATNQLNYGRGYQQNADVYGRNLESYQTNYNRLLGLRKNWFGEQAAIAGAGQGAENTLASLGQNTAQQLSATTIGAGNAQAAGTVGAGNAVNAGLGSVAGAGQNYLQYQLLSQYLKNKATVGGNQGGQTAPYNPSDWTRD